MREPNLMEATSDRDISRIIRYLDPDRQPGNTNVSQHSDFEGVLMLILLLGGVIACFVVLFIHAAE